MYKKNSKRRSIGNKVSFILNIIFINADLFFMYFSVLIYQKNEINSSTICSTSLIYILAFKFK